jgi:nicotinate-nucleotide adenylyltransferase
MDIIGLFGGTFNPIHQGHLALAHSVMNALGCHQIRFIPAAIPPHKTMPTVTAHHRAAMVGLAIAAEPRFVLDTCELERSGPSYTIDTLTDMHQRFPQASLVLILGQDSYNQLPTWYRWQSLLDLAHILVVHRAHGEENLYVHTSHTGKLINSADAPLAFAQSRHGKLCYFTTTPPDIASTRIRHTLAIGDPRVQHDLPAAVWEYIQEHQLYRA